MFKFSRNVVIGRLFFVYVSMRLLVATCSYINSLLNTFVASAFGKQLFQINILAAALFNLILPQHIL